MRIVIMYSLGAPGNAHLQRLQAISPDLEIVTVATEKDAIKEAAYAEAILGHRYLRQCLPYAERLRWVQSSAAGVDKLPLTDLSRRGIVLTRSTQDSEAVASHAIALAWALNRAFPAAFAAQNKQEWNTGLRFAPLPRQALVFGQGPVGRAIGTRLRAQGIRVTGVVRRITGSRDAVCCDELADSRSWRSTLPETDWCFLALSYTPENFHIFDESALRALPRDAVLVNIGRGQTLDTHALLRVMEDNHLAGAGLDVAEEEPLPPGHPLWHAPRVLLTPHVASHHPERIEHLERYFESQVSRYIAGQALDNVVDLNTLTRHTLIQG